MNNEHQLLLKLRDLVLEIVQEKPLNHCAENGENCIFCYAAVSYKYRHGEICEHSKDCWLLRAGKLLEELERLEINE